MQFKKAVLIKISDASLDTPYWEKLDGLIETRVTITPDSPTLQAKLQDCDCLLVGFQVPVTEAMLNAAPNLKYIGTLATAYGAVDLAAAAARGIPVCNLGGYSTESVAEFVIAALLHEIRSLGEGLRRAGAGNYDFDGIRARELKGSQVGIIGLGTIGNRVAELAAGFGAHVSYWSRTKKESPFTYRELDDLLHTCTYISVHVAETEQTAGLLDATNLSLIQPGSVLISTVPPAVIDTDALVARLSKNDMTFIFDHADEMTPEASAKLTSLQQCVTYPPIAFISDEARVTKQETFIANMVDYLEGKVPKNKVN